IDLLLIVAAQRRHRLLADDRHDRLVVELGVVEAVQQMDRSGPGRGDADADLAGELRVATRHERGHLLVARLDELGVAACAVGRAVAHASAKRGAQVGLRARDRRKLDATQREVESLGGRAIAVPTDVADFAQVEAAAEAVEAQLGPIDVWVNDAMATIFARFVDIEPEDFKRATEVTYLGAVHGTMAALRRMVPRNRGVVVQVGSALAYRAIPLQSAYCGAKFAMRGFTDSVRTELLHDGSDVWITMVQLPALNTPQFGWCR